MSRKPRVSIVVPTFLPHDAVGNDVLGMLETFRSLGYEATILAQFIHPTHQPLPRRVEQESAARWADENDILVYHHAIHWPLGEELLERVRNKIIIRYHNISPAHFYSRYSAHLYGACTDGMDATRRLAHHPRAWFWAASTFNAEGLIRMGAPPERCRVVPPYHRIDEIAAAPVDTITAGAYRHTVNVLFVGALRPHKGHRKAIEVLAACHRIGGDRYRLIFAGNSDPDLKQYEDDLLALAAQLGVERSVEIARGVSPSQLRAYYLTASVFLCVSEHEGFCVPIVEAMYFRVPIVAWSTSGVKETCAGAGIVFEEFDADRLAQTIDDCLEDIALSRELGTRARRRYDEAFRPGIIQARLRELLSEVERSPNNAVAERVRTAHDG
jgi:glycosyltransferase involved in cell wall biosynthesis